MKVFNKYFQDCMIGKQSQKKTSKLWKVLYMQCIEKKEIQFADELRLELFLKKYKPNNDSLVDKVRKLDSATLPPCSRVLLKKLKRSSYIARLWRNCLNTNPQDQDILFFGWRMKDGYYDIQWFDGDAAPKIVDVVHQCEGRIFKI